MLHWRAGLLLAAFVSASCLGSNEEEKYSTLFDSPRTSNLTANEIHGVWGGSTSGGDVSAEWRIAYEGDHVDAAVRCRFKDGTRLTPGVSIPVTYGDNTVTFANPGENTMKANSGTTCTLSVSGGTFEYRIVDNTLPMAVSGQIVPFKKISD